MGKCCRRAGAEWIDENVNPGAQLVGGALVVEPRYGRDIAQGMAADGLALG
jgi:hypothetical protein